jgi:MFS family permease
VIALGYLLIAIGFGSNALTRTLPLLMLTTALFTFGEMISMPVASAYVADLAPADQRGLYMGTYGLVWSVASICGPSLGMLMFSLNHRLLWLICAVLGFAASAIIVAGRRDKPVILPPASGAKTVVEAGLKSQVSDR